MKRFEDTIEDNKRDLLNELKRITEHVTENIKLPIYLETELNQLQVEEGRDTFIIASGHREFNTEFRVEKRGDHWHVARPLDEPDFSAFGHSCIIDPNLPEDELDDALETCELTLSRDLPLLDAVLENKDRDKWQVE
jgi:hypothetical protein